MAVVNRLGRGQEPSLSVFSITNRRAATSLSIQLTEMAKDPEKDESSIEFHAVIDRTEDGDWAVLLMGDNEEMSVDLPLSFLPAAAHDGDHLRIKITLDEASRRAAENRVSDLAKRLEKRGDTKGKKNFKL